MMQLGIVTFVWAALLTFGAAARADSDDAASRPNLQNVSDLARIVPFVLLGEIQASPLRAVVGDVAPPDHPSHESGVLPTVTAHGMGDTCFNPGMKSITDGIGQKVGSYARCIPTGGNIATDIIDGYLKNMDKSVDDFTARIRADPKLQGGFNAVGFSQGNSLIRGYIQKYNDPPVRTFLSVHGTVMGVSALPHCFRQGKPLGLLCKALAEAAGDAAYNKEVQQGLFQANYFRDPSKVESEAYLTNSQLAQWNNENPDMRNTTFAANFAKTQRFVMVKALQDSMIYPNEGEWWGAVEGGRSGKVLTMKETKFYKEDLFGLRTADEAGKIAFETTAGDHLEFSRDELYSWVQKYFVDEVREASAAVLV